MALLVAQYRQRKRYAVKHYRDCRTLADSDGLCAQSQSVSDRVPQSFQNLAYAYEGAETGQRVDKQRSAAR